MKYTFRFEKTRQDSTRTKRAKKEAVRRNKARKALTRLGYFG